MRLRQAAVICSDLRAGRAHVERLGCHSPFQDSMVEEFGLENAVYAIGDTFLEVVAPVVPDTSAARFLQRRGSEGLYGYMVLIQVDDLDALRASAQGLGVREIWSTDEHDVRSMHLHPADLGVIVSFEQAMPPESWRWGGPGWADRAVLGGLRAVEVGDAAVERWSALLGRDGSDAVLALDDGTEIRFVRGSGLMAVELEIDGAIIRLG